ncbi:hypothetical protein [Terrarubrum flagellatum]|uniref:hypothetical protein n=1 Tax=Terrirubrum flagellatum TaxID=2895980 RepID=UPI003144F549
MSEDVCAYVSGIRIGVNRVEGEFEPGDIIEYPISYLPWVDLPADVRFVSERTGREVADPFRIATHDDAVALVGVGEAVVQNVVIAQGMIRGLVINRVNGLLRPQMFARINGVVPRVITVEQPKLLDDGGASFQFSAQLHPADLGDNGLTAEIFLLGQDRPLTSVAYRRADIDDLTKRIVEFEARLAQMSQSTTHRLKAANHEVKQRLDMMQQRIDAFIEYAASFMFDRIAATEVASLPGAPPLSTEQRKKVDAFLSIVRDGGKAAETPQQSAEVAAALESALFSFGWREVEQDNGVAVRWMTDNAVVFNPHPDRPIAEVRIALLTGGGSQPSLRAAFDGAQASCAFERSKRKGGGWRLNITPAAGEPVACKALSIANLAANASLNGDAQRKRANAVAVCELTFVYAG